MGKKKKLGKVTHPIWAEYIIFKRHGVMKYAGGFYDQNVKFCQFVYIVAECESKVNAKMLKKVKRKR